MGVQRAVDSLGSCGCCGTDLDVEMTDVAADDPVHALVRAVESIQEDLRLPHVLDAVLESGILPIDEDKGILFCPGAINGRCTRDCLARALLELGAESVMRVFKCATELSDRLKNFQKPMNASAPLPTRKSKKGLGDSLKKTAVIRSESAKKTARRESVSRLGEIDPLSFPKRLSDIAEPSKYFASRTEVKEVPFLASHIDIPPTPKSTCTETV